MRYEDMSTVVIYKDNVTGGYLGEDNLMYLTLKTKILKEWYVRYFNSGSDIETGFAKWLLEYTADDTDGLFTFAKQRNTVMYLERK